MGHVVRHVRRLVALCVTSSGGSRRDMGHVVRHVMRSAAPGVVRRVASRRALRPCTTQRPHQPKQRLLTCSETQRVARAAWSRPQRRQREFGMSGVRPDRVRHHNNGAAQARGGTSSDRTRNARNCNYSLSASGLFTLDASRVSVC